MNIPISNSPTLLHKTQHRRVTLAVLATWFIRQVFWDFKEKFPSGASPFPSRVGSFVF
jgi:hypothetical protein